MLSVVIPTRNRVDYLCRALDSLTGQTLPTKEFEVLVVDNGSTDQTVEVVDRFAPKLENLRYFYEPQPGLHVGRHKGLQEASSDLVVFADDDIRATTTWLEAIAQNFADPAVFLVGGNNLPDFQGPVPTWLQRLWARPAFGGQAIGYLSVLSLPAGRRQISPYLVWGCNFAIRKQVVLDAGGFHPDSMPQELVRFRGDGETHVSRYVAANGLGCVFDSRAGVYHAVTPTRMTFDYFIQRAFNQGISDSFAQLRNSEAPKAQGLLNPLSSVRRLAGRAKRRLTGLLRARVIHEDIELRKLTDLVRKGHAKGFAYHQRLYHEDPEVRAWVQKSDYF